jgi:hypothetical protein
VQQHGLPGIRRLFRKLVGVLSADPHGGAYQFREPKRFSK